MVISLTIVVAYVLKLSIKIYIANMYLVKLVRV